MWRGSLVDATWLETKHIQIGACVLSNKSGFGARCEAPIPWDAPSAHTPRPPHGRGPAARRRTAHGSPRVWVPPIRQAARHGSCLGTQRRRTGPALGDVTKAPSLEVTATAVTDQIPVEHDLPDRVVTEL